jgi:hypothetical protein
VRLTPIIATVLVLFLAGPSFAQESQEWIDFTSAEDHFTANFPGQPKVTNTTYKSEYGADLPARVYSATAGQSRYILTAVDYNQARRILTEKAKQCPPGDVACNGLIGINGEGNWKNDVRGAIVYVSWQFIQRDAKLTHYLWNYFSTTEGHQLQLTNNADQSRTFVSIFMQENRLYILEGTVPAGYPPPQLFQESLNFLNGPHVGMYYNGARVDPYEKPVPPPASESVTPRR